MITVYNIMLGIDRVFFWDRSVKDWSQRFKVSGATFNRNVRDKLLTQSGRFLEQGDGAEMIVAFKSLLDRYMNMQGMEGNKSCAGTGDYFHQAYVRHGHCGTKSLLLHCTVLCSMFQRLELKIWANTPVQYRGSGLLLHTRSHSTTVKNTEITSHIQANISLKEHF